MADAKQAARRDAAAKANWATNWATNGDAIWADATASLDRYGNAILPSVLHAKQCEQFAALYSRDDCFRSRIVMARHNFGRGEYKYFAYPLPPLLERLRHALYRRLAPVANRWNRQMGLDVQYPAELDAFLARCHAAGQTRPTPLMLRYHAGDYNCLHQDLYGDHVFPLQVAILLSVPGEDFTGGEFVMTETGNRAGNHAGNRGQHADVVALRQGDAVVFAVNQRPDGDGPTERSMRGRAGVRKVAMRHGVSVVRSGTRHTLGLIFHDAREPSTSSSTSVKASTWESA
ncbi:2OG-Fe(II) oxygenase [Paraburkholderia tagetis]|uniref:2OG-Fe(II) oxygenase n=1 Tax=Paraburkholderia tagetis TaxID=2913261 RepID=A0A9X1RSF4_9BURK|nr:2OG-Fe(II) oxygenase [Paraburkholderia tagetis]MCG5075162.1 2OG-Fe(II) oxygenase [Paraburkholderia tagetis]